MLFLQATAIYVIMLFLKSAFSTVLCGYHRGIADDDLHLKA